MDFGETQYPVNDNNRVFDLPCLDDTRVPIPNTNVHNDCLFSATTTTLQPQKESENSDAANEEVIASGFISRAPLPIDQVQKMEVAIGANDGAYFIELMRKRLQCVRDVQVRWLTRTCNKKQPRYVEIQNRLKCFAESVLNTFDSHFGIPCAGLADPPTRRHMRSNARPIKKKSKKQ